MMGLVHREIVPVFVWKFGLLNILWQIQNEWTLLAFDLPKCLSKAIINIRRAIEFDGSLTRGLRAFRLVPQ